MKVYAAYRGRFVAGWMLDDFFGRRVLPILQGKYQDWGDARTLGRRLLKTDILPDVGYRVAGVWHDESWQEIPLSRVGSALFREDDALFFKSEFSNQELGVTYVHRDNFDPMDAKLSGNLVVQRRIRPHAFFDQFGSGRMATLRITTIKPAGRPTQYAAAYIRFGSNIDGTGEVGAISQIRASVINDDGELEEGAALANWHKVRSHPASGETFAGKVIPEFRAAVKTCVQLHERFPHVGVVGWDVGINDRNQIELMEWNTAHPDIKFSEATEGPCFSEFGWESLGQNQKSGRAVILRKPSGNAGFAIAGADWDALGFRRGRRHS
ncbi:MAG: hypothetical protein J6386_10690 [Candidatus Synoicihabitans palmerolidicus]|nr:hypothetical protein [Candidatus Synoicihabitans palmerolidicus]